MKVPKRKPLVFQDTPLQRGVPFFGTPEQMVEDIRRYREAGVTQIVFDYHYAQDSFVHMYYESAFLDSVRFHLEVRPLVADLEG